MSCNSNNTHIVLCITILYVITVFWNLTSCSLVEVFDVTEKYMTRNTPLVHWRGKQWVSPKRFHLRKFPPDVTVSHTRRR
jgi:hypothetical protein